MSRRQRFVQIAFLILLCWALTTILQQWVGGIRIYSESGWRPQARATLHEALLANSPPEGKTWVDMGANALNTRVFVVYLAEGLERFSPLTIHQSYRAIDSVSMFLAFLLLSVYLSRWFSPVYCLIGVLYVSVASVLTYHFFYFHPWDRISLVAWIIALIAATEKRVVVLAITLAIAMTIKYDILLFPLLYGAYIYSRDAKGKALLSTFVLLVITLGLFVVMRLLFPEGGTPEGTYSTRNIISKNLWQAKDLGLAYPPLLAFAIPLLLAASRFRQEDRFVRMSLAFCLLLFPIYLTRTYFREVRAEMPLLILLLPAALSNLKYWLETHDRDTESSGMKEPVEGRR